MISVHELTKCFETGGRRIMAVDHLSFSVAPGEVYGLLGPNGAGKTTTLRMIVGLLRPDHGYAEVGGFRTTGTPDEVKSQIGLVTANDGIYPWLTVREMLLFFADLYGLAPRQAQDNLRLLSKLFDLGNLLDGRCATLSTGQRQRVTLCAGVDPRARSDAVGRANPGIGCARESGGIRLHRTVARTRQSGHLEYPPAR